MSQNVNQDPLDWNPGQPRIQEHGQSLGVRFIVNPCQICLECMTNKIKISAKTRMTWNQTAYRFRCYSKTAIKTSSL